MEKEMLYAVKNLWFSTLCMIQEYAIGRRGTLD